MSIIRNSAALPETGDEFTPPEIMRQRQLIASYLENDDEPAYEPDTEDIVEYDVKPMTHQPAAVRETVEQRLTRELETLSPAVLGRLFSTVLRKTGQEKIEVMISGCRIALQVVSVAVGSNGMSFLIPKDTAFEPDMGLEFTIVHRGRPYPVISTKQFYPFPGLDFNVASFMFVAEEGTNDQARSNTSG